MKSNGLRLQYEFTAVVWKHSSDGSWYFVSLPEALSNEIRSQNGQLEEGWGRLRVTAVLIDLRWDTAIWFDTRRRTYLLPIKSDVRKRKRIQAGDALALSVLI
jgi:hypothetical protein